MSPGPARLDIAEAIDRYAPAGATVYVGNFGAQLFAVGHELIRGRRSDLHVIMGSGGILLDQMLAAGVVAEATFGHCWSPVGPAPAYSFRRLCENGAGRRVRLNEVTLGMLASALRAAAWGVPFMPVADLSGTVFETEAAGRARPARVRSPFGEALVVPALRPDVAFIHVDRADENGNGVIPGPAGEAPLAAQAAEHVVLVAEEVVDADAIRREPSACVIPGALVSAVVEEPFAVHPDGVPGRYERDVEFYASYSAAARTEQGLAQWLIGWIYETAGRAEYAQLVKGG